MLQVFYILPNYKTTCMTAMSLEELLKMAAGLAILVYLTGALILRTRFTHIPIWALMTFAAFTAVAAGLIPFDDMTSAIDFDVVFFLIGMFSIVAAAESSGILNAITFWFINRFKTRYSLVIGFSTAMGLLAAFALNDTVALMGPPIAAALAKMTGVQHAALYLLLAFSITLGSAATPLGNPQNILVAVGSGMRAPFIEFLTILTVPTLLSLVITSYIMLKLYHVKDEPVNLLAIPGEQIVDRRDAYISGAALAAAVLLLIGNDLLALAGLPHIGRRGLIPFVLAAAIYPFLRSPRETLQKVDWGTIVFFIAMFISMEGVWRSGAVHIALNLLIPGRMGWPLEYVGIFTASLGLSQLVSNVPYTKLMMAFMQSIGYGPIDVAAWLTLATASTLAGNLTIFGAASNIIIIEVLERKYGMTITFKEFVKAGLPITAATSAIYTVFLTIRWFLGISTIPTI
jgi:Na+/H+ antiporter NhaD/arsenite permease-like protein